MCIIDPICVITTAGVGGLGLCAAYAANSLKTMPHPSECGLVGRLYLISGWHSHEAMDLIVDIHEAVNDLPKGKYFVEVSSGRFKYRTQTVQLRKGSLQIHEKLNVHVRQCDDDITINLYMKHLVTSKLWGTLQISVDEEILSKTPPRKRRYTMTRDNAATSKLTISIYKMNEHINPAAITPLTMQVLIQAQQEGNIMEEEMLKTLEEMCDSEKLRYFARVISGPLKKLNAFKTGYTEFFFKPFEVSPGYWLWCFWESFEKYNAGERQIGSIPLTSISLVTPDRTNRKRFYLRYHSQDGKFDLMFKTLDRDRDIWVDGLNEFVAKATDVYSTNAEFQNLRKALGSGDLKVTKAMDTSPKYHEVRTPGLRSARSREFSDFSDDGQGISPKVRGTPHTLKSPVRTDISERERFEKNLERMAADMYGVPSDDDF